MNVKASSSSHPSQISEYTGGNLERESVNHPKQKRNSLNQNTSLPPLWRISPLPLLRGKVPPGADSGQPAASSRDTTSCKVRLSHKEAQHIPKEKRKWDHTMAPLLLACETQVLPSWSVAPRLAFAWTKSELIQTYEPLKVNPCSPIWEVEWWAGCRAPQPGGAGCGRLAEKHRSSPESQSVSRHVKMPQHSLASSIQLHRVRRLTWIMNYDWLPLPERSEPAQGTPQQCHTWDTKNSKEEPHHQSLWRYLHIPRI